jgi:hypothetical protein
MASEGGDHRRMHRREFIGMSALALAFGARAESRAPMSDPAFEAIFARMAPRWGAVARDPAHAVRLRWVRIDRDGDGRSRFRIHDFGAERDRVWAPAASVVKLPMALLMAEALQAGGGDAQTRLRLDAPPATGNWGDEPIEESFARGIARTFAVSDNAPFNRWYELLGGDRPSPDARSGGHPDSPTPPDGGGCDRRRAIHTSD